MNSSVVIMTTPVLSHLGVAAFTHVRGHEMLDFEMNTKANNAVALMHRLEQVCYRLADQTENLLHRSAGISTSQWRIIDALGNNLATTSRALLHFIGMDAAVLSRHLKQLEKRGVVRTDRALEDKRVLRVFLTPLGRDIFEELAPKLEKCQDDVCAAISDEEQMQLNGLLLRLDSSMDAVRV